MITRAALGIITATAVAAPDTEITIGGGDPIAVILELVPGADIDEVVADFGLALLGSIESQRLHLVALPPSVAGPDIEGLDGDPRVEEAEEDDDATAPEAAGGDTQPIFFFVPPESFESQVAMDLIEVEAAHEIAGGGGVVVAVIDTGVDATHELLEGRIAPGGYNFVDGNTDVDDVATGLDRDGDGIPDELHGHGTFVAGLVATVAPDASILPIRVLDSEGFSNLFRIVQGIHHAIEQDVDVINLSLGTRSQHNILRDAVEDADAAGIVVVAAAGDDDRQHPAQAPASEQTTLAVAATEDDDVKCGFSNFGAHISLTAPGRAVVSAMPEGAYAEASGTSIATALMSGAVALLQSADDSLSRADIETLLYGTAQEIDSVNPGYQGLLGAGRVDVAAAVAEAAPPDPEPRIDPWIFQIVFPEWPRFTGGPDDVLTLPGVR